MDWGSVLMTCKTFLLTGKRFGGLIKAPVVTRTHWKFHFPVLSFGYWKTLQYSDVTNFLQALRSILPCGILIRDVSLCISSFCARLAFASVSLKYAKNTPVLQAKIKRKYKMNRLLWIALKKTQPTCQETLRLPEESFLLSHVNNVWVKNV